MSDRDEESLWAYVTRTIRPLWRDVHRDHGVKPAPVKKESAVVDFQPWPAPAPRVEGKDYGVGLDRRNDDRLRRGQMPIEARLDLHGMTLAKAQPALKQFLLDAQGRGLRCVLVITGKGKEGQGIIRQSFPVWLGEDPLRDIVLRHYPAKPKDGGAGAFYILLRRNR